MDNFMCGGYVFSSNFDSGNLNKVELVNWNGGILLKKKKKSNIWKHICPYHGITDHNSNAYYDIIKIWFIKLWS